MVSWRIKYKNKIHLILFLGQMGKLTVLSGTILCTNKNEEKEKIVLFHFKSN